MDVIKMITDANFITTVWLDQPAKSVNTISSTTISDLSRALDEIERDEPFGVIFASAKPRSFIAGADLFALKDAGPEVIEELLKAGQILFSRIADLPIPTVAAINGDCLGGGLEVALACKFRVAADDTSIKIGLPEVKLGLVPGWGGTMRLPRTIGLARALPMMLAGKTLSPKKAYRAGLVDDVVRPEALMDAARRIIRQNPPRHRPSFMQRAIGAMPLIRNRVFLKAKSLTEQNTSGHYPAPLRLIDVVREGYEKGPQSGLNAERAALVDMLKTETAHNLIRIFFLRQSAKKAAAAHIDAKPQKIEYATVVGGGTMGAGIIHSLISVEINVRLVEVNSAAVSAGLQRIQKMLDDDVQGGRITALAARHAMNRVTATTDWSGLGLTDFAIEAVVEQIDAKREVFARLDQFTPPNAILASNTSSLNIQAFAEMVKNPGRVIGMHFFNPVPKMPLVEIIAAKGSDAQALANAIGLAGRLGKTPVVVRNAPGFLVNRVLIPYLAEAALMAREGISITAIDAAMQQWGWPMGPFRLLDEIGLDVAGEVLKQLAGSNAEYTPIPDWMKTFIEHKWLGKKTGTGFYVYGDKAPRINPEMKFDKSESADEIQWRLMLPMINEAARVLDEHIVDSADAIDLATVMGIGFPPFRGGLAHYAESVGHDEIVRRLKEMTAKYGRRFEPAERGETMVRNLGVTHANLQTS